MHLNLDALDDEMRPLFEKAYASFRERTTCDEEVRNREPFVGPGRRTTVEPLIKPLTVDSAFDLLIKSMRLLRRNEQPASEATVEFVWQNYKGDYAHGDFGAFPSKTLAELNLSVLLLHDVFSEAKGYMTRQVAPRSRPQARPQSIMQPLKDILTGKSSEPAPKYRKEPYGLIVTIARRAAKSIDQTSFAIARAKKFLVDEDFDLDGLDEKDLRALQAMDKQSRMYPRTNL